MLAYDADVVRWSSSVVASSVLSSAVYGAVSAPRLPLLSTLVLSVPVWTPRLGKPAGSCMTNFSDSP